jgi:hypothetical protein
VTLCSGMLKSWCWFSFLAFYGAQKLTLFNNVRYSVLTWAISVWLLFIYLFIFHGATAPSGTGPSYYRCFTITIRHTTRSRTFLDEWSARRTDLYLTTHSTHKRQTSMPTVGFEPATPASERPETHALDRAAAKLGSVWLYIPVNCELDHTNAYAATESLSG